MLKVLEGGTERNADEVVGSTLDELAREGAQRMIRAALKVEVEDYLPRHPEARDPVTGRALVVDNGKGKPREVTTAAGTFKVQAPRVNDMRVDSSGERCGSAARSCRPTCGGRPR
jgi:putative transposase